jgi:hypothetical protein
MYKVEQSAALFVGEVVAIYRHLCIARRRRLFAVLGAHQGDAAPGERAGVGRDDELVESRLDELVLDRLQPVANPFRPPPPPISSTARARTPQLRRTPVLAEHAEPNLCPRRSAPRTWRRPETDERRVSAALGDERGHVDIEPGAWPPGRWRCRPVSRRALQAPAVEAVSMSGETAERIERDGGHAGHRRLRNGVPRPDGTLKRSRAPASTRRALPFDLIGRTTVSILPRRRRRSRDKGGAPW